jgi:hypothetical protein
MTSMKTLFHRCHIKYQLHCPESGMCVSPHTVKEYMRKAQVKWKVHSKNELRLLLAQWDFSAWGEHPGTP